jgi:flavodoxin
MAFNIAKTTNGPLVQVGNDLISIMDTQDLIAACESNSSLLDDLWTHIQNTLQESLDEYIDGLSNQMQVMPTRLFSYINSCQQYFHFKNHHWVQYVRARDAAMANENA